LYHKKKIKLDWVHSEELEKPGGEALLRHAQGIIVPGGFGIRGIEGMLKAAKYARQNNIPYFGICLGMQIMVIELARFVLKSDAPNSSEFNECTPHPVIAYLPEQRSVKDKGGTMRLGEYPCQLVAGTIAAELYNEDKISERHRHRYEFNNDYREQLAAAGMVYSGLSPDGNLVEICEMKDHKWMLGCQFHPEFLSRPGRPHPLFRGFVGAAMNVLREGAQPSLPLNP
jgi:CTP synthase